MFVWYFNQNDNKVNIANVKIVELCYCHFDGYIVRIKCNIYAG